MTTYTNPGAIANMPPTPNKVESSWGNAIRDRTIQNFATTSARDAAITSPVVGMHCYVVGEGLQQYSSATLGWTQPWYLPWGEQGYAEVTANQTGVTTVADLTGLTLTATLLKDRIYRISLFLPRLVVGGSGGSITVSITDSANGVQASGTVSNADPVLVVRRFVPASTLSYTRKGRLQIVAGGTVDLDAAATSPAFIQIEDIGAHADPT